MAYFITGDYGPVLEVTTLEDGSVTPPTVSRSGTVTRSGQAVEGAEVVLISKADLIAAATATTTTDSSGGYTVEVPTGEEMVVIGLDGEDGDSAAVTESG